MTAQLTRQLQTGQRVAALVTGLTGMLGVLGWLLHSRLLIQIGPQLVSMKFNTAVGLLAAGIALVLLRDSPGRWPRLLGGAVALLGILTSVEYFTGLGLGIDDFFLRHPVEFGNATPGRMSLIAALLFATVGSGIVAATFQTSRGARWSQRLALFSLALSSLTILGFAEGLALTLRGSTSWAAVALNTAIGLVLAAVALLWARPVDPDAGALLNAEGLAGAETRRFVFVLLPGLFLALALTKVTLDLMGAGSDLAEGIRNLILIVAAGWAVTRTLTNLAKSQAGLEEEVRLRTAQLRESETKLRLSLDAASLGLYDYDVANERLWLGEGALRLLGLPPRDPPIYTLAEYHALIHPDDLAGSVEAIRRHLLDPGTPIDHEYRIRRPDGSHAWIHSRGRAMGVGGGDAPSRLMGVLADASARKALEAVATQHRKDLETLLYVASHDLREPLRAIENFSQIVRNEYADRLDERGRDFLDRVVRAAVRLHRLLEDLQGVAKAQGAGLDLQVTRGVALADEVLGRMEHRAGELQATITVAGDLPDLLVDATWATQALYNLVANACKFTPQGIAPMVEIAGVRQPGQVGLMVADRGVGVPEEIRDSIFELFRRGVGREVEGTGAGLAIVRQVASRHGGRAWAEPRDGGGTKFFVTFGAPPAMEA